MMFAENPKFKKWITISSVLGFVAFMAYLFLFTNFTDVESIISGTNIAIYFFAFVCVIASSTFDALAWKATIDSLSIKTNFRRVFSLSWVGRFVDTLIPGGLAGDAFKTYLLAKDKDANGSKAAASIIIKDVLELVVVLGSLVIGIFLLVLNYSVSSLVLTAIGVTMIFLALPLVLLVYLGLNPSATEKLLRAIERLSAKIKGKQSTSDALKEKLHNQIREFTEGGLLIKKETQSYYTTNSFPEFRVDL